MKNIIFDVGDVLLEYRWKDMLVQDYGMTEERAVQIGKSMFDDPLWSGLDLGNPLEETICRYEKKISGICKRNPVVFDAWRIYACKASGSMGKST